MEDLTIPSLYAYRARSRSIMLLVDLDNILFLKGEFRLDVFKLRLKTVHGRAGSQIHWFCNIDTDYALRKSKIVLKGTQHVHTSEKDRADHALIQYLSTLTSTVVDIITADMSLIRLAMFITSSKDRSPKTEVNTLHFLTFGSGATLKPHTSLPKLLVFDSVPELQTFSTTLSLYHKRYPLIPRPSSARVTPKATAFKSRKSFT